MKIIITGLYLVFCFSIFAQPLIPYATQQPKWVFPIYAEDATGKKDTIYIAYDPNASNVPDADISMGEVWHSGVNDFSLSTYYWADPVDSIIQTNVLSGGYLYFAGITLSNVVMPVTFKWDVSLMRSDSLPFPDQDPVPRAQLNIYMPVGSWIVDEPGMTCDISYPIIVSDTVDSGVCNCHVKDSLRLLDPFGNITPQSFFLDFWFSDWFGHDPYLGLSETFENSFLISPNPADELLRVTGIYYNEPYQIFDMSGKLVSSGQITGVDPEITIGYITTGLYLVTIKDATVKWSKN